MPSETATVTTDTRAEKGLDRALLSVAIVVVLGAIMSILDTTVVNVAISHLSATFDTSLETIQWIVTGYTLALATVIPITGWAADRFGTKRLYMLSLGLFLCGSILSGLAWSAESLIAFRVLQGLGGGMLMPAGMTILTRAAGPQRVGRVMSIIGVPMLLGPIVGPILGGWLVDDVSWRWIFFINIPIGIAALALSLRVLPRDVTSRHERFDTLGIALLSPGLALFIYGLAKSSGSGGFASTEVLVPGIAGVLLLVAFVLHALRTTDPLIDVRLFTNRTFAAASATLVLFAIAVFGSFLLLPLYFQTVRGETAMQAGLLLAPQGLGAMLVMPIAGQLTDRTGVGRIVLVGLTLTMAAFLALTQIAADTSYWALGAVLFVMGMGLGSTMMPIMSGAMQTLRRAAVARASTTVNILQQVGASIGTAVLSVTLAGALADRLPRAAGSGATAGGPIPDAVRERIAPLMAEAYGHTFWVAVGLLAIAFFAAALLPWHKPAPPVDEEATDEDAAAAPVLVHA
jgi:EmrB/QacA subfamily drug resistance transporter